MTKSSERLGLKHAAGKIEVRACSADPRGGTFANVSSDASVYLVLREGIPVTYTVLRTVRVPPDRARSAGDSGRYSCALPPEVALFSKLSCA